MATWWKYCFSNMRISTSNSIWHAIEGRSGVNLDHIYSWSSDCHHHNAREEIARRLHRSPCLGTIYKPPQACLHSARSAGFDRAKKIGRSLTLEIASMTAWVNALPTILPPIRTLALTRFAFVSIVADITKENEVVARRIKAGLEDNALQDENIRNKWMSILTLSTK